MSLGDLLLVFLALGVSAGLAWRAGRIWRVLLFASALLVSASLFFPGARLAAIVGPDVIAALEALAARTPWRLSAWLHFLIFAWLGLLVWLARPDLRGRKGIALLVVLAVAAELAQGLTATREMRVGDVVLNLMGCAVGIGVGAMLRAGGSGGVSSSATSRR